MSSDGLDLALVAAFPRLQGARHDSDGHTGERVHAAHVRGHGTAAHVEALVRKYRAQKARVGRERANGQQTKRELSYYWDEECSLVLKARLPAAEGARVLRALELGIEAVEPVRKPEADDSAKSSKAPWTPVEVDAKLYPQWGRQGARDSPKRGTRRDPHC